MRSFSFLVLFLTCTNSWSQQLLGFEDGQAMIQRALEARFDSSLNRDNLREWMKRLTARPHHTGSAYDKDNAEFIASLFRSWGYATRLEEFQVLFPTPKTRLLEMTAPTKFTATLKEPAVAEDATSGQADEQLPAYNAYSIDGDVTGELVYVNYGVPKDYEELERNAVDVKGKIVMARYGGSWRGIKPKVAAEHGAIGCIIYSDPRDDGYFEGDVYPVGAYRNENGAQRGSVMDIPIHNGDPLTPFVGATKDAKRLKIKDATTLTKIPVLPISYADALPLLRSLQGPVAPESWRGALPITYHIGPGPAKVHLKVEFNWNIVPIYDVIATMKGSEYPDEWVIRGNHSDAWVNGAHDPVSGLVSMLEEARAVAQLTKSGWKPKRTIVYAAWDAEEQGLMGSTEWVETHADELKQKAVAYVNSDGNGRGFLSVGGSHTLEKFANEVARDVIDPETKVPVAERLRARRMLQSDADDARELRERSDLRIYALGSGSDYTPFIQHLGISCLNIGYGGEDGGGEYHSIYDSFDHFTRFIDPRFEYGLALTQTAGRVVLRLANAPLLPFEFGNFTETVGKYVKEVEKLANDMREQTEEQNRRISERTFELAADPTKSSTVPKQESRVPFIDFTPLRNAFAELQENTDAYRAAGRGMDSTGRKLTGNEIVSLNEILMKTERALTTKEGLPRRPWYVHEIVAPGLYTGYGVKTLPAIREAIEQRSWTEANKQVEVVAEVLEKFAREVKRANRILESALPHD